MKKHQKALLAAAALVVSTFTFSGFGTGAAYAATPAAVLQAESQMKQSSISELTNDTRVFKVDPRIEAKNVRFQNRYGFDVAGHLYLPKNFNAQKQYKAVVVPGATHTDLYDQMDKIPFADLVQFFDDALK